MILLQFSAIAIVADIYREYLEIVLTQPAVIAVITWGTARSRSRSLRKFCPPRDGANVRLPLDDRLNPKLAWFALANALNHFKSVS